MRFAPILLVGGMTLAACASGAAAAGTTEPSSTETSGPITPTTTTTTTTSWPLTTSSTQPVATTTTVPSFSGSITEVDAERLAHSWREGCPVPPENLRMVSVTHWDFEESARFGSLVVHRDHAKGLLAVFKELFEHGYPMSSIVPVGDLDPEEIEEPGQNNTSAFNCRFVAGTTRWSEHAKGLAIDVNPQLNPYISGDVIDPPEAARYVDRTLGEPGMILPGDVVVVAFETIGWTWGGSWRTIDDLHHFSATGK